MLIEKTEFLSIYEKMKTQGVALYGAGDRSKIAIKTLREFGVEIKALADREQGKECEGIRACSKQDLIQLSDVEVCIVTVTAYVQGLLEELQNHFTYVVDMGIVDALNMIYAQDGNYYQILSFMMNSIGREDQVASLTNVAIEGYQKRKREELDSYAEVRLYRLWSERIGEFLCRSEKAMIISEKHKEEHILDVFILSNYSDVNKALLEIVSRNLCIVMPEDMDFWKWYILNNIKKMNMDYWDFFENRFSDQPCVVIDSAISAKFLSFTDKEEKEGEGYCQKMGLSSPFVCVANRDSSYLRKLSPQIDYSYHDFRDSKIETFKKAVDMLADNGVQCVRTGYIRDDKADFCIDYANKFHDDFMDLYLSQKCMFYLGDLTGLMVIPEMMDKILAYTNVTPLNDLWSDMPQSREAYFILKKYYKRSEDRFLNLYEILDTDHAAEGDVTNYQKMGIEIISNTPDEICDLAHEVYLRIKGEWHDDEECVRLQDLYFKIYSNYMMTAGARKDQLFLAKMGAKYLMQNKDVLFDGIVFSQFEQ